MRAIIFSGVSLVASLLLLGLWVHLLIFSTDRYLSGDPTGWIDSHRHSLYSFMLFSFSAVASSSGPPPGEEAAGFSGLKRERDASLAIRTLPTQHSLIQRPSLRASPRAQTHHRTHPQPAKTPPTYLDVLGTILGSGRQV
ncbi:hypothetical protein FB451DRAFT_1173308 [Mycena latifolia]|nr:hypothetical protein FB451DRAFT_1173308 [Mycena latifolia]